MASTPKLDKSLFVGGLGILAVAGVGAVMAFNAPCTDVGCIVAGVAFYFVAGLAAVGAVLAAIGGIRIKHRKSRLESGEN